MGIYESSRLWGAVEEGWPCLRALLFCAGLDGSAVYLRGGLKRVLQNDILENSRASLNRGPEMKVSGEVAAS